MPGKSKRDLKSFNGDRSSAEQLVLEVISLNSPISMSALLGSFPTRSDDWVKTKVRLLELEGRIKRTGSHNYPVFHAVPPHR